MIYKDERPAVLVLKDGKTFEGVGFGVSKKVTGEIVFNTIPGSGYVQMLTNPTNKGKIIVCTYPSIGNYGVQAQEKDEYGLLRHFESDLIHPNGIVVSEYCKNPSHYESVKTLEEWLVEENIPGIQWVDTRRLTQYLVKKETTMGILQVFKKDEKPDLEQLQKEAKELENLEDQDIVKDVSTKEVKTYQTKDSKGRVAILDLGTKNSILRILLNNQFDVSVVPYDYSHEQILQLNPKGIIISNGPGNPKNYDTQVEVIKKLFNDELPILGIGLGHNLIGRAAGAQTYKMKAPHLGGRTTVESSTDKCFITFQNHAYCIENFENEQFIEVYYDKDDETNEGLIHTQKPILSVLFNPEGSPGPLDMRDKIFNKFFKFMEG